MAFAARSADSMPMSEINITPLIDVMLALLLIFMLTAPVVTHYLPMPLASGGKSDAEPRVLDLSVKQNGELYLEGVAVTDGQLAAQLQMASASATAAKPLVVELRAEATARYDRVADMMALATRNGVDNLRMVGVSTD